jgi:ribosomal protein S26
MCRLIRANRESGSVYEQYKIEVASERFEYCESCTCHSTHGALAGRSE